MIRHKRQVVMLRTSMVLAGILGLALCLAPAAVVYAAPDAAAVTAPVAPAVAPATAPAAAPVAAAPAATPAAAAPAAPAAAPEPVTQAWWQAALIPVLSFLGLFLAGFLVGGLRKLVKLIETKWNIDIPDAIEKLMYEKARWGLGWAEEQADKRLLHGDGVKTPGAEKLSSVVDMLLKFADSMGYGEEWTKDKVEALAEGVLHLERSTTATSNIKRDAKITEKKNGGAA